MQRIFMLDEQKQAGYWNPKYQTADEMLGILELERARRENEDR